MPDLTLTLDMLEWVRSMYGLSFMPGYEDGRLWRIEKYLVGRLERAGLAAPPDTINDGLAGDDPTDEYDYLAELIQPDMGGSD